MTPRPVGRQRRVFSSPHFHRLQRRHFLLFDVLPALGCVTAVGLLPWLRPSGPVLAVCVLLWLATGLGLTVGFHRLFSHRAFTTGSRVAVGLMVLGSMAGRGSGFSWAAMHRRHHELADRPGDPHSPNLAGKARFPRLRGFLHAHLIWMRRHDYPNVGHYIPDLMRNGPLAAANRRYYQWVLLGLAIPAAVGVASRPSLGGVLTGLLWGGAVRMCLVEQTMSSINSLMHLVGVQPFGGADDCSRNLGWLALASWGEGWHNNHHAFPNSAAFGHGWRQPDPGLWAIRALAALGLAWDVRTPAPERLAARRAQPQEAN
ncbi:MAG TPA: acyl-CoA desaturase [Stellaceae bacterium]|jgi:stearoyl-CoA desaturase (delta-9 desaturase)